MDGLSKVFQSKPNPSKVDEESMKVGASLDQEVRKSGSFLWIFVPMILGLPPLISSNSFLQTDDNIPLRIMLLLMDEVFDLKSRNQWLRRRIVTLLRQIIRTMFGDIVNRRIVDYVALMTSPEQVADYLRAFKYMKYILTRFGFAACSLIFVIVYWCMISWFQTSTVAKWNESRATPSKRWSNPNEDTSCSKSCFALQSVWWETFPSIDDCFWKV